MKEPKYTPISCSLYDELELLILRKSMVDIEFEAKNSIIKKRTLLANLFTKDKQEYLVLENGQEIRLDKIKSMNDKPFIGSC